MASMLYSHLPQVVGIVGAGQMGSGIAQVRRWRPCWLRASFLTLGRAIDVARTKVLQALQASNASAI